MTARLPGPGPQLSTGRLRVDAGRAIAKLREYQLADRSAWILEALRAAVASGATAIFLDGDSNDVWLRWQGEPWPVEVLPQLFDELVSPSSGAENQHVRLLAAAVNSALGMNPAYVDVFCVADGATHVVRYTPDVLAEPENELGESKLKQVAAEPTKPPKDAKPGMVVHLRRRLSLEVLGNLFKDPPELNIARSACWDITVPLCIAGVTRQRSADAHVLEIPLGDGVDGAIRVERYAFGTPRIDVLEHAVRLDRFEIDLGDESVDRVPLSVFVDAPHMPTNASRSQVRRDKHPISTAAARAKKLVPDVLAALERAVAAGDPKAREAALWWIAAHIGGPQWHVAAASIGGPMRSLGKHMLVRNAVGEPRPLTIHWRSEIHRGKEPLPAELGAWVPYVLWLPPGDPAECLLRGAPVDSRAMHRLIRYAKRQAAAQRKFLAHAKREARIETTRTARVRMRIGLELPTSAVEKTAFEGFSGEVAVFTEGSGGSIVVLLDGRELERVSVACPVAFEAVIDSSRLKPADRYRGVERDAEYARLERAAFAAVIRAIEAVVLARKGGDVDADFGDAPGRDADARLFRGAIALVRDAQLKLRGPLAGAPLWETTDGRWVGAGDLAADTVGVLSPLHAPASLHLPGRTILYANDEDRILVGKVAKGRIVNYDRTRGQVDDPQPMIAGLAAGRPCVLAIREGDLVGAIAPANKSTVQLHHAGVRLDTHPRKARYIDSAIVVTSSAIVPDTDWRTAHNDAGLATRDYGAWELALVRAMARAISGELAPELRVPGKLEIEAPLGLALCEVIVATPIDELFDLELATRVRNAPLLTVNGRKGRLSLNEVVALHPGGSLPVIPESVELVGDFAPLVAPNIVAAAVSKLIGRPWHDATGEVQRRQRRALFEHRLAEHCAKPAQEVVVHAPEKVSVPGSYAHGEVGVANDTGGIRVYVERRLFATLPPPDRLPVVAALEIAAEHCNERFDDVPPALESKLQSDVRRAIPALLVEVAAKRPAALVAPGPVRVLLAATVKELPDPARRALIKAPAWKTVQGETVSFEEAAQPHGAVRKAAYADTWLAPDEGEPVTAFDDPVLAIGETDAELLRICSNITTLPIVDVTDDVVRLQANRRMARGLLPTPKVNGVPPELKRPLAELGEVGKKLGHGELALLDSDQSQILIHAKGRFVRQVPIDVRPAVALAIEEQEVGTPEQLSKIDKMVEEFLAEDRHPLQRRAQQLAVELVKQLVSSNARALTRRMRLNIGRALLAKRLQPSDVGQLPVLATLDGPLVAWSVLENQIKLFGDVWAVWIETNDRPLDERRVVLDVSEDDLARAKDNHIPLVDAREELRLDALARRNRARPQVIDLALPTRHGVMAEGTLDGDGTTKPRGIVAIVAPAFAGSRGVTAYRNMYPLGTMSDPCAWPTIAVVDDARLVPDRTWSEPKQDQTWQAIAKQLRTASEALLATVGEAPEDALVSLRIDAGISSALRETRKGKSQIRGIVWLSGAPHEQRTKIHATHRVGITSYVPTDGMAIGGQVLVYTDAADFNVPDALAQACGAVHGTLVRMLLEHQAEHAMFDDDVVLAHVVNALANDTLKATDVRGHEFPCFAPYPLEPRALVSLLRRQGAVPVVEPGQTSVEPAVIDDGSHVSRVVLAHLGKRARRVSREVPPAPAPPQPVTSKVALPGLPPQKPTQPIAPEPPKKPAEPHPLQEVIEQISARVGELGLRGYGWTIVDGKQPMVKFELRHLFVAGENPKLRSLATLPADSPFRTAAIDAIAAHVVSVLNIALTEVTDASEVTALAALLSPRSADPPRSRRSS